MSETRALAWAWREAARPVAPFTTTCLWQLPAGRDFLDCARPVTDTDSFFCAHHDEDALDAGLVEDSDYTGQHARAQDLADEAGYDLV